MLDTGTKKVDLIARLDCNKPHADGRSDWKGTGGNNHRKREPDADFK